MEGAGYDVEVQPFEFPFFRELAPAVLQRTSAPAATFATATSTYSGTGDVTAAVTPVDLDLAGTSTSGCEASDFAGFPAGAVALIRRGTCTFAV